MAGSPCLARLVHVVAHFSDFSDFSGGFSYIVGVCYILLPHSSVSRWVGRFCLGAIMNNSAMNIYASFGADSYFHFSWGGIARPRGNYS